MVFLLESACLISFGTIYFAYGLRKPIIYYLLFS